MLAPSARAALAPATGHARRAAALAASSALAAPQTRAPSPALARPGRQTALRRPPPAARAQRAGFHVRSGPQLATVADKLAGDSQSERILVLYGSQTGTTEAYAKTLASFARARGLHVRVASMAEWLAGAGGDAVGALGRESHVVLMTSTFYNGEFPDNALPFYKALQKADPQSAARVLKDTRFAVFGLGNKANKDNFNAAARKLEQRVKELGAKELVPAGFGDEFSSAGHEAAFRPFVKSIWFALGGSSASQTLPISHRVTVLPGSPKTDPTVPAGYAYATVRRNEVLSKPGLDKEVRVVSFEAKGYPVAGHVLVAAPNPASIVSRAAAAITLPPGASLDGAVKVASVDNPSDAKVLTVRQVLAHELELQGLATRSFLEALSVVAKDEREKEALVEIAEGMQDGNEYSRLTTGEIFSYVDAMEKFPSARLTLEQLLSTVPRLQPRYFSVASSPLASPDAVDVVFARDTWAALSSGKRFEGVASTYLAGVGPGDKVAVRLQESPIQVPAPDVPVVAVGLGTGIGVSRGLLQHWAALKKQGRKVTPIQLFYGFRHSQKDKVFQAELQQFVDQGVCQLTTAAMDEGTLITGPLSQATSVVTSLLDSNGVFVYTGPGGSVPQAVELAVQEGIAAARKLHPQAAGAELSELKKDSRRWIIEGYSREVDVENILREYISKVEQEKPLASSFEGAKMLCFQCEQTYQGRGCTTVGVCGKTPQVAALQDLLVDVTKRLGFYNHQLRTLAASNPSIPSDLLGEINARDTDRYTLLALFSTLTNVNFDGEAIRDYIVTIRDHTTERAQLYEKACKAVGVAPAKCPTPDLSAGLTDPDALAAKGELVGILAKFRTVKNDTVVGLAEMLVYGLKGVAAYADHAVLMGEEDIRVFDYVNEALAFLISPDVNDLNKVVGMLMKCGETNLITMGVLHKGNAKHGVQSPHKVPIKPSPGKAILISGHDMKFLEELLEQTKGTGINVYTHGEMLPAHGYPKLREYGNLVGHFGVAWQRQSIEFPHFPGPIVMTTNCLTPPSEELKPRIFTAGAVGFPGCTQVKGFDFKDVIKKAQEMPGFGQNEKEFTYPRDPFGKQADSYNVGFGLETVLSVAPTVISSIEKGDITRFYVIGGCDGFEGERSYYTDVMEKLPPTSVVLTLGCGKYRVLGDKLQYATIGDTGIPRLLDIGQCNDTYGAVQIAVALANHFKCGVNDLPLSLVISWFEQKAIAVLLTLLHLNLKGVRVGPRAPAFIRPAALQFLVDTFDLKLTGDPEADVRAMVGGPAT